MHPIYLIYAGKGGDGASHSQKQEPLIYAPDGRLPQPTKLGLVVQDAVRRWYLEAENDMNRGDVVRLAGAYSFLFCYVCGIAPFSLLKD